MRRFTLSLIALLVLPIATALCADLARDAYMGAYIGKSKVGYLHTTLAKEKLQGRDVYCLRETLISRLRMEGRNIRSDSTTTLYLTEDLKPIRGVYEEIDNGAITRTEARFLPGRVECKTTAEGKTTVKSVAIPAGVDLSVRMAYEAGLKTLRIGDEMNTASFDAERMAVTTEVIRAVRREEVDYKGGKVSATVIVHGSGRSEVTDWRLDSGEIARSEMPGIGAVMIAQTKQEAMSGLGNDELDLDTVKTDKPIPNPRRVKSLKLRLIGIPDKDLVKNDSRQRAEFSAETSTAVFDISAAPFDPAKSTKLPIKRSDPAGYLKPSEGIESRDERIIGRARGIVAGETNALKAARKLRAWVQTNVKPSDEAATTLSAVDVLTRKAGCCRHNAVLYAALARAAGIPTRLAAGLIYDAGSFRFHVWAESWVGQWVAIDPTYPGDFVDATHIKLVEGGIEELPALGRVAGRLRAQVIAAK